MKFCLYIIIFPNNKKYIGMTSNFSARKNRHKSNANQKRYQHLPVYRAINKYGFNNLKWDIDTNYSTWEKLSKAEINAISKLKTNSREFGYNCTNGGEGLFNPTKETRAKISKANKGRSMSNTQKQFLSLSRRGKNNPMFGKSTSKKQKEVVSKATRGEKNINSKLTNQQANEIRNKYHSGKYLIQNLAKEYNLNRNTISKIIKNKSYVNAEYPIITLIGNHKLTLKQAKEIRDLYKTNKYTQKELAKIFNVCGHTIFRIVNNKSYIL